MSLVVEAARADRGVEVGLHVAAGETVAVLGPNGAGKSTVLALVAGLLRPDRGRVVLDGRTLSAGGARGAWVAPHDRAVALLAQDPLLFPHLDVRDNAAFGPRAHGLRRGAARERADRWLREVGVSELARRRPAALSGGQAQRVAIARALAAEPRVLLLDEPLAALDVAVAPAVRQTLRRVLADRTVLLATHDVLDALLLADRVLVLEDGRVAEEGPTATVLARPRSGFGARIAGLNLVAGTWRDGRVVDSQGREVWGEADEEPPTAGGSAVAVFRPVAVSVHLRPPGGSPRNALPVTVSEVEPHGHQVRIRAGDLSADITPRAAAELDLVPGRAAYFVVKATEVTVYSR